jgi:uncharacterized protein YcnI
MQQRHLFKPVAVVAGALALLLVLSAPASAHVTVQPPEATQGGFAKLTFRVPNESDTASTIELRVQLPQDHPFTSVSVKPKQGWQAEVTERTLDAPLDNHGEAVTQVASEITWTGGQIRPGEFDEFEISVGRMPTDTDQLFFPAIQTYDDGEVSSWIELPTADGEEPENPAPELTLLPATDDDHHGDVSATPISAADGEQAAAATSEDDHGDSSNGLAVAALVVGGIAIILSIVALAASRRTAG